jgi:hypothetical protein
MDDSKALDERIAGIKARTRALSQELSELVAKLGEKQAAAWSARIRGMIEAANHFAKFADGMASDFGPVGDVAPSAGKALDTFSEFLAYYEEQIKQLRAQVDTLK